MVSTKIVSVILISIILVSFIGISYAENKTMNVTNVSESGNLSHNVTEQANVNLTGGNKTDTKNQDDSVSTGGIRNFMKSFKYQSSV
jgi:hypothetical protein